MDDTAQISPETRNIKEKFLYIVLENLNWNDVNWRACVANFGNL